MNTHPLTPATQATLLGQLPATLDTDQLTALFGREGESMPEGNRQLRRRGALPFPPGPWPGSLCEILEPASVTQHHPLETAELFALGEAPADYRHKRRDSSKT